MYLPGEYHKDVPLLYYPGKLTRHEKYLLARFEHAGFETTRSEDGFIPLSVFGCIITVTGSLALSQAAMLAGLIVLGVGILLLVLARVHYVRYGSDKRATKRYEAFINRCRPVSRTPSLVALRRACGVQHHGGNCCKRCKQGNALLVRILNDDVRMQTYLATTAEMDGILSEKPLGLSSEHQQMVEKLQGQLDATAQALVTEIREEIAAEDKRQQYENAQADKARRLRAAADRELADQARDKQRSIWLGKLETASSSLPLPLPEAESPRTD